MRERKLYSHTPSTFAPSRRSVSFQSSPDAEGSFENFVEFVCFLVEVVVDESHRSHWCEDAVVELSFIIAEFCFFR